MARDPLRRTWHSVRKGRFGPVAYDIHERMRFYTDVAQNDDCWIWRGPTNNKGYGQISVARKFYLAHRIAWELVNGSIPDGLCVMHKCDNPACVNVSHLGLGSHAENMHDSVVKKRHAFGARNGHAKLTNELVLAMRARTGESVRVLAREYGVAVSTAYGVLSRSRWRHLA